MDAWIRLIGGGILLYLMPLSLAGFGDLVGERSGLLCMCIEGTMITGAFFGVLMIRLFSETMNMWLLLAIAIIASMIAGLCIGLIHAFAAIHLKADQNISATSINTFAPALTMLISKSIFGTDNFTYNSSMFIISKIPVLGDIPILGPLLFRGCYPTTFIGAVLIALVWFVLYKTRFGLQLRSTGENPQASDSVGINVYKMRYIAMMICGAMAGFAGFTYILTTSYCFMGSVYGYGFLALSIVSLGQWKPSGIIMGALLFGSIGVFSSSYSVIPFIKDLPIPSVFYLMLPYIITLIVVALTPNNFNAPAVCGEPYDKGKR
ncbi:MAG: ABC transporter permease [Erysipelotrichaceae bacterium]|nr:ABC transporter permease [Erysipelotrichaceae bacterium]